MLLPNNPLPLSCMLTHPYLPLFQIMQMAMMLSSSDAGVSKNACFALSCLAASQLGHQRLLATTKCDMILKSLAALVCEIDDESSWFAAMLVTS